MSTKGKQISVIIAGATGSLGQEIVSRLVSHPDVSRVVALARHPIPVNRWTSVFPHLHIGDARRYLSVVPVNWEKILADASHIPCSYVSDGVWRFDEAEEEWKKFERHRKRASRSSRTLNDTDAAFHYNSSGSLRGDFESATLTTSSGLSDMTQGYIKMPTGWPNGNGNRSDTRCHGAIGALSVLEEVYEEEKRKLNLSSTFDRTVLNMGVKGQAGHVDDTARRRLSQEFMRQLLQNSFYRSIFSGHQVAINCIGTSHVLSSAELALVDYDLSIAFAKIVRLFNCMTHAEPTEDEERLLVETTSRELDSVLWNEIYSACYGKSVAHHSSETFAEEKSNQDLENGEIFFSRPRQDHHDQEREAPKEDNNPYAIVDDSRRNKNAQWMNRGQVATLRHFSQVSVRAANEHSPVPYLRVHGKRDRDLLKLFNRWRDPRRFASHGFRLGTKSTNTSVHVGQPVLVKQPSSSLLPAWMRMPPFLRRVLFGTAPHSTSNVKGVQVGHGLQGAYSGDDLSMLSSEEIARKRAQMLLRRDVVKIWEQANLSIWRSGVFRRSGRRRIIEQVISLMERPVDVRCLAECIVDDIVDSFYNVPHDQGSAQERRMGKTKVISGSSVARRTYMKALEDGLYERETQRSPQTRK